VLIGDAVFFVSFYAIRVTEVNIPKMCTVWVTVQTETASQGIKKIFHGLYERKTEETFKQGYKIDDVNVKLPTWNPNDYEPLCYSSHFF